MQNKTDKPVCAATAIAAVLALSATPLAAQDLAAPPLDGPIVQSEPAAEPAASASPAPVLIIPEEPAVAEVSVPEPVASPAAAAVEPPAEPVPQARSAAPEPVRASAASAATPTPAAAESAPLASADTSADEMAADETAADEMATADESLVPVAAPLVAAPQTAAGPTPRQSVNVTAILGVALLALIALAIAVTAFLAFRRRRRPVSSARERTVPPVAPREHIRESTAVAAPPVPVATAPSIFERRSPVFAKQSAVAGALPSDGASVDLPTEVPATFEERDVLLRRMIDAPPDRANPFTDRRARLHRARLILQSLGRRFENAEPWIDFSQYPNNWPALARPRSKAA